MSKKIIAMLLVTTLIVFFAACSNLTSKDDINSLQGQVDMLKDELEELKSELKNDNINSSVNAQSTDDSMGAPVLDAIVMTGISMLPTLSAGDEVAIDITGNYIPSVGDVIAFHPPLKDLGEMPLIKRVIAIGGQTVDIDFESGDVFIDGIISEEPYINELTHLRLDFFGPVIVPEGYVFVLGDNRNRSVDSRDAKIGVVDIQYIIGRIIF